MENCSSAAALAIAQPPSCLSEFTLSALPAPDGLQPDITARFAVSCARCGGADFRISGFPKTAPDPSPYFDVAPGETLWRPPHGLACVRCGHAARILDVRTDGYDGVLNGGRPYESGVDGEAPIDGAFRVTVAVLYNIEIQELEELAAQAGVRVPDLFDFIEILGDLAGGGPRLSLGYECA